MFRGTIQGAPEKSPPTKEATVARDFDQTAQMIYQAGKPAPDTTGTFYCQVGNHIVDHVVWLETITLGCRPCMEKLGKSIATDKWTPRLWAVGPDGIRRAADIPRPDLTPPKPKSFGDPLSDSLNASFSLDYVHESPRRGSPRSYVKDHQDWTCSVCHRSDDTMTGYYNSIMGYTCKRCTPTIDHVDRVAGKRDQVRFEHERRMREAHRRYEEAERRIRETQRQLEAVEKRHHEEARRREAEQARRELAEKYQLQYYDVPTSWAQAKADMARDVAILQQRMYVCNCVRCGKLERVLGGDTTSHANYKCGDCLQATKPWPQFRDAQFSMIPNLQSAQCRSSLPREGRTGDWCYVIDNDQLFTWMDNQRVGMNWVQVALPSARTDSHKHVWLEQFGEPEIFCRTCGEEFSKRG